MICRRDVTREHARIAGGAAAAEADLSAVSSSSGDGRAGAEKSHPRKGPAERTS
jgi:hypothetical protein